jgi:hypothetical protein
MHIQASQVADLLLPWPTPLQASSNASRTDIQENFYLQLRPRQLAEQALLNEARGSTCFDMDLYRRHSPDLAAAFADDKLLWRHFLQFGQFEERPHRWVGMGEKERELGQQQCQGNSCTRFSLMGAWRALCATLQEVACPHLIKSYVCCMVSTWVVKERTIV